MLKYDSGNNKVEKIETFSLPESGEIIWFHLNSETFPKYFEDIASQLNIHPLASSIFKQFSDIPKLSIFKHEAVVSLLSIEGNLDPVKMSILVGPNYVITNEEKNNQELLNRIMKDFKENPQHMQDTGHLLYHLVNHISFVFLEAVDLIADEIQRIEKSVFKDPFENEIGKRAYRWKAKLHDLRQIVEPQENVVKAMGQSDFPYINEDSGFYFQDLQQNYARIVGAFDAFKETIIGIFNLQISLKADHTNTIMKTLTLVSVIFIPMTFIAGLYGMNFEFMPELKWKFGYFYALIFMLGIGSSILLYFRIKGWWGKK